MAPVRLRSVDRLGAMNGPTPRFTWRLRNPVMPGGHVMRLGQRRGLSRRLMGMLGARGVLNAVDLESFVGEPERSLHDPLLLPDATSLVARIARATADGERVLVFGDFDADGLAGLAILTLALRRLSLDVATYVPDRDEEGYGLSSGALQRAAHEGRTLIVTADCGTASADEVELARRLGIDVIITDHHRPPPELPRAEAVVNPLRHDSMYPDRRLSGAGVAFKCAQLLIGGEAMQLADLAAIGTVADVAPLVGENRAIVRLGLDLLRYSPRPGVAALLDASRIERSRLDPESLEVGVVPRLNAAGRVGDAALAARLLLATDADQAAARAAELEVANEQRKKLMVTGMTEARLAVASLGDDPVTVVAGPWTSGIIGLLASRLVEEYGRPAVVFSSLAEPWRGSGRSNGDFNLVEAMATMPELLIRYGGHAGGAFCEMPRLNFRDFQHEMRHLGADLRPVPPTLLLDTVVDATDVDYAFARELAQLAPSGAGNPAPLIGIRGLIVNGVQPVADGHTQVVLRKRNEVLDGICFNRDDLVGVLREGYEMDVVARVGSRQVGGYESIQLDVRDICPPGTLSVLMEEEFRVAMRG